MRYLSRTYPQPDSPAPNIGPRERALAVLKYIGRQEPEVTDPRSQNYNPEAASCCEALQDLYESHGDPTDSAKWAVALAQPLCEVPLPDPTRHPLFACLVHSFQQAAAARAGAPLSDSLVPLLRSGG